MLGAPSPSVKSCILLAQQILDQRTGIRSGKVIYRDAKRFKAMIIKLLLRHPPFKIQFHKEFVLFGRNSPIALAIIAFGAIAAITSTLVIIPAIIAIGIGTR